ncbi:MAG: ATPase, T2SS/T4P/T4SS family [Clostridia bacterium]|nr:ATPase, T2SS/T4P/T4SS family [Clostridia bacterium]
MQNTKDKKIEDILVEAGLIDVAKLDEVNKKCEYTGEKIEKILLSDEIKNQKEILSIVARKMGVEFVDLENISVNKKALQLLTADTAKKYFVFPFDIRNNLLFLAMENPDDIFIIDEIKVFTQMEIKPFLAEGSLISNAIEYFYPEELLEADADGTEHRCEEMSSQPQKKQAIDADTDINKSRSNSSGVDIFIKSMFIIALKNNATHIHIDKVNNKLRVRYRVDGSLIEENNKNSNNFEMVVSKLKALAGLKGTDLHSAQKGYISYELSRKESLYVEVLALATISGDKLLIKVQERMVQPILGELGFTEHEKTLLSNAIEKKSGMVISTGTGRSGRTTTCYALLKEMSTQGLNIITIEEKIREEIEGIGQIQIHHRRDEEILNLLESVSDHDPDVVMLDTLISKPVIDFLMRIALSGKKIIVTLPFPNVYEALLGLINMGIAPYMIASSVDVIIAQNLIRKLCAGCLDIQLATNISTNNATEEAKPGAGDYIKCKDKSCNGKIGLFEVFFMNNDYKELLIRSNNLREIRDKLESEQSTFKKNFERLIAWKLATIEETRKLEAERII